MTANVDRRDDVARLRVDSYEFAVVVGGDPDRSAAQSDCHRWRKAGPWGPERDRLRHATVRWIETPERHQVAVRRRPGRPHPAIASDEAGRYDPQPGDVRSAGLDCGELDDLLCAVCEPE